MALLESCYVSYEEHVSRIVRVRAQKPTNLSHIEALANKFGQILQRERSRRFGKLTRIVKKQSEKKELFAIYYLTSKQDLVGPKPAVWIILDIAILENLRIKYPKNQKFRWLCIIIIILSLVGQLYTKSKADIRSIY